MKGIISKYLLFVPLLLLLMSCGSSGGGDSGGGGGNPTTPQAGRTCVWDTSAWDNCDLGT